MEGWAEMWDIKNFNAFKHTDNKVYKSTIDINNSNN
jgi:hypothetical protein